MRLPSIALPIHSRIAPTPSGYLHLGNAFSFLLTWFLVRASGGTLLLRIDDLDAARKRPQYLEDIFRTLEWLQITYDLGPSGPDDFEKNFSQVHRAEIYATLLSQLAQTGIVFACTCTRTRGSSPANLPHRCACRDAGLPREQAALRVFVPGETCIEIEPGRTVLLGQEQGNFVVRRRDGIPAYQLTSIADDLHYGIDTVVRGEDLTASTAMQIYLLSQLNQKSPRFFHHALLLDTSGSKLSKSTDSPGIADYRAAGGTRESLLRAFCAWAGMPELTALDDILDQMRVTSKKT